MKNDLVISTIAKLIIPFIVLYAFVIQINGEHTPGGGFQSGLILASAFILHALIFGSGITQNALPITMVKFYACCGVLIYLLTGIVPLCLGGNFLDYSYLLTDPIKAEQLGIILVEIGVGFTVFAVIMLIYFSVST